MKLSLRRKIVGGYGLLLFLIVALGWVTLSLFNSLRSVQRQVHDEAIPALVAVDEIVRSYTAQTAAVRGYLINTDPQLLARYENELAQAGRWEAEARRLLESANEKETLRQLVNTGNEFQTLVEDRVLPLAEEGRKALAFAALGGEGDELVTDIELLGAELRSIQDETVASSEEDLASRSNQAVVTLVLVTIGALAVGIVVALVLPARLGTNIGRLVDAARAVGRGELDHRVEIKSGDEVEELSIRFNEMQSGLKRLQQLALQDRELEIAASIQRNLLQRVVPEVPGLRLVPLLRQANRVGGDWYDVEVAGDALTVVIGDASGKGIGAALMATVALSVLRAERGLGASPQRVVARANEALLEATDPDSFTTVVYATVDAATGEVVWLNMGHPPPFVLKARRGRDQPMRGFYAEGVRNKTIGWFEDPGLSESTIRLEPGDRLILYTDGFLEAKDPAGRIYGDHRFAEAIVRLGPLDAADLTDELVKDVERFATGKLDDDLTMIVVEFQGARLGEDAPRRLTGEEPWHSRR
ncbi:MAG: SpoIIE family protein phosphatase [Actinomycetota bacterium]|nr:SpoIIE family protein phosphatase [Actinomycetota bacterium]